MKVCSKCNGVGWFPSERDGLKAVTLCDCRREATGDKVIDRAHFPPRHRECDFEHFNTGANESLRYAKIKAKGYVDNYPNVKEGLLFLGNPGVGKTHLAVAIAKELMMKRAVEALFCSYQELFQQLRESYDTSSKLNESRVLAPVLDTELVIIDDLGASRFTEWSEDTITYVLNHRYNEKKPTILTSNLPDAPEAAEERKPDGRYRIADTLTQRIGIRVRSRLYEMCDILTIKAEDFRQTVQSHRR
jgi:DNA replication protein DnaC